MEKLIYIQKNWREKEIRSGHLKKIAYFFIVNSYVVL
jgi:hypothetical protein